MTPFLIGLLCAGPIWAGLAIGSAFLRDAGDRASRWWRANPPAPVRAYRRARVRRLEQRITQLRHDNTTETTR